MTIENLVCSQLEGNDPVLESFLQQAKTQPVSGCLYEKGLRAPYRTTLLIVDNTKGPRPIVGHYDLGERPRPLPMDVREALTRTLPNAQLVDVTHDLKHKELHERGGEDIRSSLEPVNLESATQLVNKAIATRGAMLASQKVETPSKATSGLFGLFHHNKVEPVATTAESITPSLNPRKNAND